MIVKENMCVGEVTLTTSRSNKTLAAPIVASIEDVVVS